MASYINKIYMQVVRLNVGESTVIDTYGKPYPTLKATVSNLSKREKRFYRLTTNNGEYYITRMGSSARPETPYSQFVRSQVATLNVGDVTIADVGDKPVGWFRAILNQVAKSLQKRFKTRIESEVLVVECIEYVDNLGNAKDHIKGQISHLEIGHSTRIDTEPYSIQQCKSAVYNINKDTEKRFKLAIVECNIFIIRRGDKQCKK